jgi:hypothetical protein
MCEAGMVVTFFSRCAFVAVVMVWLIGHYFRRASAWSVCGHLLSGWLVRPGQQAEAHSCVMGKLVTTSLLSMSCHCCAVFA